MNEARRERFEARSEKLFARHRSKRVHGIETAVVRFDGAVYFVPKYAVHRPVAGQVLRRKYAAKPLHDLVGAVLERRPGNLVHAGTFFGDMLPSFSRKAGRGLVHAFEPVLENYLLARLVTERNELDNVVLLHAGLAETSRPGLVETFDHLRHRGGGSYIVSDPERETFVTQRVPLVAIDQLGIENLSLVQLDVEGFERQVLLGARETIARDEPVIMLEDNLANCGDVLADLGYERAGHVCGDDVYVTPAGRATLPGLGRGDGGPLRG